MRISHTSETLSYRKRPGPRLAPFLRENRQRIDFVVSYRDSGTVPGEAAATTNKASKNKSSNGLTRYCLGARFERL